MLEYGWSLFALGVAGPLLLAALLERAKFNRTANVVLLALGLAGVGGLLSTVPREHWPLRLVAVADAIVDPYGTTSVGSDRVNGGPTHVERRQLAEAIARAGQLAKEAEELKARIAHLEGAVRDGKASRDTMAIELEAERAAHVDSRRALDRAKGELAGARTSMAAARGRDGATAGEDAVSEQLERNRAEKAKLEARIRQLESERVAANESDRRVGQGFAKAVALIAALEAAEREAQQRLPTVGANPTTPPVVPPAQESPLESGMEQPLFRLLPSAANELVKGLKGRYYRVACLAGGRRLGFSSGSYELADGNQNLASCFEALGRVVFDKLPAGTGAKVFVQGFASDQRFVKPKPIPASDTQMRDVSYLPRTPDGLSHEASPRRQKADTYANKELMTLRGASVANAIAKATNGEVRPEVLEGDVRAVDDEAATSFDIVIYVDWRAEAAGP